MKNVVKYCMVLAFILAATDNVGAQITNRSRLSIKTNLLHVSTATINLSPELRLSSQMSLETPFSWNPWQFNNGTQCRFYLAQPELRLWTRRAMKGHFFGLHGHYAFYNIGGLPKPFSPWMQTHRVQGTAVGAGVSYGYRWNIDQCRRWSMEAALGVGYARLDYETYECNNCQKYNGRTQKNYFGPTKAALYLIYNIGRMEVAPSAPVVTPIIEPRKFITKPTLLASLIVPEAEAQKSRSASGAAYLEFEVGRSKILPAYKGNAAELDAIRQSIETVRGDESVSVTGIEIVGYASPEGKWTSNLTLSGNRAQALLGWVVAESAMPRALFTSRGAGEDWAGLEKLVKESEIGGREAVLEIIRKRGRTEETEHKLAAYPQVKTLYPPLRRVEYRIGYDVAPMTVARGKEVLYTRPELLSLNEMFLIAETMEVGSAEWAEVFDIAARVFPESDVANINAAASAIERGDVVEASKHLGKVQEPTPQWWNNTGVVCYMNGDLGGAAAAFAQAGDAGRNNRMKLTLYINQLSE